MGGIVTHDLKALVDELYHKVLYLSAVEGEPDKDPCVLIKLNEKLFLCHREDYTTSSRANS